MSKKLDVVNPDPSETLHLKNPTLLKKACDIALCLPVHKFLKVNWDEKMRKRFTSWQMKDLYNSLLSVSVGRGSYLVRVR